MGIPDSIQDLFAHPAPGLVFAPHPHANVPRRLCPVRHELGAPPRDDEFQKLGKFARGADEALSGFLAFYTEHSGLELCVGHHGIDGREEAAFSLLPIREWDALTGEFREGGGRAWQVAELPFYHRAAWTVFAQAPSEGTVLTIFFDGAYNGQSLAGKVFYLSLDPALSELEPVANSFDELLDRISLDPGRFLNEIGWTSSVTSEGFHYGDLVEQYVADVTPLRDLARKE